MSALDLALLHCVTMVIPSQTRSFPCEFTFPATAGQVPFLPVRVINKVEPEYTKEARKAQLEGTVSLYVEVGLNGIVEKVCVLRSLVSACHQRWKARRSDADG